MDGLKNRNFFSHSSVDWKFEIRVQHGHHLVRMLPPDPAISFLYINIYLTEMWASLVAQTVKNLPAVWDTQVRSLDWEDPLEKGLATHSGRIPWTEEPSDTTEWLAHFQGHSRNAYPCLPTDRQEFIAALFVMALNWKEWTNQNIVPN